MVYQWKPGTRVKVQAQVAGNVCEKLEREGRLTAADLVNESRPADAPLHNEFNWNDAEAAELFRQSQARTIISLLVVIEEDESKEPTRAFFCVSEASPKYDSVEVVVENEDKLASLKAMVVKELQAIQRRYKMVAGLEGLAAVIEAVQESA